MIFRATASIQIRIVCSSNKKGDFGTNAVVSSKKFFRQMRCRVAAPDSAVLAPLVQMLQQYFDNTKAAHGNSSDYTYAHAVAYIHQHYKGKINLADVYAFCHCSKSYISHMFKKRSGMSVSNYITALRLEKAKMLLEGNGCTVKAAAKAVGFAEPYYFSNAFKKIL